VFLDSATVSSAQRVARYAMATYSRAIAYAKLLGQRTVADLLTDSLTEERTTIETLGRLAEDPNEEVPVQSKEFVPRPVPALRQA
jgi:ferritin-like metal-binding protein YciE